MTISASQIRECLSAAPASDVPGSLPVIFAGNPVRFLGHAASHRRADELMILHRLSAERVSRAQVKLDNGCMSAPFFVCHA